VNINANSDFPVTGDKGIVPLQRRSVIVVNTSAEVLQLRTTSGRTLFKLPPGSRRQLDTSFPLVIHNGTVNAVNVEGAEIYYSLRAGNSLGLLAYPDNLSNQTGLGGGISVKHGLVSLFSYLPGNPRATVPVQFTDESKGLPTSWLWDFGDDETSTDQNPAHEFEEGVFDVKLTVRNAVGEVSVSVQTVSVDAFFELHSHWKLDESAGSRVDSIGTNDLAIFAGSTISGATAGKINNCIRFPGVGGGSIQKANTSSIIFSNPRGYTITGWSRCDTGASAPGNPFLSEIYSSLAVLNFRTTLRHDALNFTFTGGYRSGVSFVNFLDIAASVAIGSVATDAFHFFRAWVDMDEGKAFLQLNNGAIVSENLAAGFTLPRIVIDSPTTYIIGGTNGKSRVDEVSFFDGVLPDWAASAIYNGGNALALSDSFPGYPV